MQRLRPASLSRLTPEMRVPRYDRAALAIGLAHIGVGAFHRCHQAEYTDDMLDAAFGPWGVIGINIRPPRLADSLGPQDGLYSRTLKSGGTAESRVIGCIRRVLDVESAASTETAIATLAASEISTITLTLTEKGYCHVPATGVLDPSNPGLAHDLAFPSEPSTALGLLAAVFERRCLTNAGPVTLVSCDNLPSNGLVLERVLTEFAAAKGAMLRNWIKNNVTFPCTMVDRIVPATTPDDLDAVSSRLGVEDLAAVVGEPFRQWVIADTFAGDRPPWDLAGAQFTKSVEPYEIIKMRVLNAAQSTLSHLGPFLGHDYSCQAAADPLLGTFMRRLLTEETASTLPIVSGMPIAAYIDTTFARIGNSGIQHRCHQIGTDGSQKIVQRILRPLQERLAAGRPAPLLSLATASWIAYVLAGAPVFGSRWSPVDPFAEQLITLAQSSAGDLVALSREILCITAIFGVAPPTQELTDTVAGHVAGLLAANPRSYLARVLGS